MSTIAVSAGQIGIEYVGPEASLVMRIYTPKGFTPSSGTAIVPGRLHTSDFYDEIACTVVAGVVSHAGFNIDSTTDALSNPRNAYYTFYLYTTAGRPVRQVYARIYVPDTPTPTTLGALATYSAANPANLGLLYYTAAQVNALLAGLVNMATKATELIYGAVKLSVPAASAAVPIAIGDNDPRVATLASQYLNSLSLAVAAIGATETMLVINAATTLPATLVVPSNIRIVFTQTGKITVASGQTLTIGLMDDPGNKQVFIQADATANIRFSPGAVDRMNVAWFTGGTPTLCTNAINQILASITANSYGRLYLPEGEWTTAGNHTLPDNTIIEGAGLGFSFFGTTLRSTTAGNSMFLIGQNISNIEVRNLTLDGDSLANVNGVLCTGTAPNTSTDIAFVSVSFVSFVSGFRIDSTDGSWQVAAIHFDHGCVFSNNSHSGIRADTVNSALTIDANFFVPVGAWAVWLDGSGAASFRGCEFAGAGTYGVHQMERTTIVAAAGITGSGTAEVIVTAADLPGSPVTVLVPLTTTEHTTANLIAAAFRTALKNDPEVASFFHIVLDSNADITTIAIDAAANDGTMNIEIASGTTTGITPDATSTNVKAGVAPSLASGVLHIAGTHPPISFFGCQDEQFNSYLVNDAAFLEQIINFYGGLVQNAVRLDQSTRVNLFGCNITSKAIRDGAGNSAVEGYGNSLNGSFFNEDAFFTIEKRLTNFTTAAGGGLVAFDTGGDTSNLEVRSQLPFVGFQNDIFFGRPAADAWWQFLSTRPDQRLLRWGACNAIGKATFYYDLWRETATGRAKFQGNQAVAFKGYDFDADIIANRFSPVTVSLDPTSPISLDANLSNAFSLIPTGNATIDAQAGPEGTRVSISIITAGTSSFTITFGAGFKTQGALATGTTDSAHFVIDFVSNGSDLVEVGTRGAAII